MADLLEIEPTDDSLMAFDGRILEIFFRAGNVPGRVSARFHVNGIEAIEITEGWGRSIRVKYRFGSNEGGIAYEKDRLPEVREFADRVMAAAQA